MSKYRIVSNGYNYKIQEKILWLWIDVEFFLRSNIFKTEEEATEVAKKIKNFSNIKNYIPVKYLGEKYE